MKEIVKVSQEIGADKAGQVEGSVLIEDGKLKLKASVEYGVELIKVLDPAEKALDENLDKLKAAIPGDWDDAMIEQFKLAYKASLTKYLSDI